MDRRQPINRALVVVVACALALSLAGCTPRQSQAQYEERLDTALQTRDEVQQLLDGKQLDSAQAHDEAAAKVAAALAELDADAPPRDLAGAHGRMVAGLEGLETLLRRLGRCDTLEEASQQDARACRASIGQDVYDGIRNDFGEANTIYRAEGLSSPLLGSPGEPADGGGGDVLGDDDASGGDVL